MRITIYGLADKQFNSFEIHAVFSTRSKAQAYLDSSSLKNSVILEETLDDDGPIVDNTVYISSYTNSSDLGQHIGIFSSYNAAENYNLKFYSKERTEVHSKKIDDLIRLIETKNENQQR